MSFMGYLRGFIPWIVFAVFPTADWKTGALVALLTGLFLLRKQRRAGVPADALVLEASTAVYFVGLTMLAFAAPHSPLHAYSGVLSFAWLALTAWGSLAVGHPFTLGIAKRNAPRQFWGTPQFIRVNVVITTVWAISFTLTAAATGVFIATDAGSMASLLAQVIGFAIPAVFTAGYPKIMQARYAAAAAPATH